MGRRIGAALATLFVVGAGVAWVVTAPRSVPSGDFLMVEGDPERGAYVFAAAGCASCHAAPSTSADSAVRDKGTAGLPVLAGGQAFPSPFGTFYAPNVSPDPDHGIGTWTQRDFANSLLFGTSPEGTHYFPAFPYTSYAKMGDRDIVDLWAYMQSLPESDAPSRAHEVGFPFNLRRGVGLWKILFFDGEWAFAGDNHGPELTRGRYLVEALGHCAECHTPRNALGGLDRDRWMRGAPDPSGTGEVPALTPDALDWSAIDIAYYLETGFTPEYDSAGGHMAKVIENTSRLTDYDREAIAAYIKALPAP